MGRQSVVDRLEKRRVTQQLFQTRRQRDSSGGARSPGHAAWALFPNQVSHVVRGGVFGCDIGFFGLTIVVVGLSCRLPRAGKQE